MAGQFVGQTKKNVEEKLNSARGGVLFIDEAYDLGKGKFGQEVRLHTHLHTRLHTRSMCTYTGNEHAAGEAHRA